MVALASPTSAVLLHPLPPPRPCLGSKRDSSYLDTDDEAGLSLSTKKLKVAFDPNVDVRIMDDWNEKSLDLVKEEVRTAIERHLARGDRHSDVEYTELISLLGQDASSDEAATSNLLTKYLIALNSRISQLGGCGRLVIAAQAISWLGRSDVFVTVYTRFLAGVLSTHSKFAPAIMEELVSNFAKLPASQGRLPSELPISRAQMFTRLHLVIKTLLRQVPSASNALMKALRSEFPNDLSTTRAYIQYQKHLLRSIEYVPEIKTELLALITQRVVAVDVQIQQDIEGLEEDDEDGLLQRRVAQDNQRDGEDSDDSDDESVTSSEETCTEEEMQLREIKLKVAKMDGSLDLLFEYYSQLINVSLRTDTNVAFQQLLSHFAAYILPNRCRHSQFLLFHFSQMSTHHVSAFAECALKIALNPAGSATNRFTACAYLASFVARGSRIPAASVCDIVDILCHYLNEMRQRYEPTCRGPDKRAYSTYYAVTQALLYIFCFRWRDLAVRANTPESDQEDLDDTLAEGRDLQWLPNLKETLRQNIYSRLNPLKVCSPTIVTEFARIANHLRFLYIYPLLETNKRVRLGQVLSFHGRNIGDLDVGRRETAFDRKAGEAHHQVEAYFPFDPYHLPKSKRWVEGDYNEWKLPSGMQRDDDDEGEYEKDDSDYDSDEESMPEDAVGLAGVTASDNVSISS